jgi:hypothetical protein
VLGQGPWIGRAEVLGFEGGALTGYSALSEAMSIEKRYFTSDLSIRS